MSHTRERTGRGRPGERVSVAELNTTASKPTSWGLIDEWRSGHEPKYSLPCYRKIRAKIQTLPSDARPDVLREMLRLYDEHPKASPGLIPYLYDDAVKACRGRAPAPIADPDAFLADIRQRAAAAAAARLLGVLWIEPCQPPSDPTPPEEWLRVHRIAWIDQHADQIRAAVMQREAG